MPNKRMSEDELLAIMKKFNLDLLSQEDTDSRSHSSFDNETNGEDGYVEIADNRILVKDPHENGRYPFIQAVFPVILKKNGVRLKEKAVVSSQDTLEWETETKPLYKIEVSPDKMKVFFRLFAKHRYGWKLTDKKPSPDMLVEAEEDTSVILDTVKLSDIMKALSDMHITKNVRPSAILQELQNPTHQPILIAQGVEPSPSKDAVLNLLFSEQIENAFTEIGGTVDFRSHLRIPSAKKGDVIAIKTPPVPGEAGYDVYGNIIIPPPPKDIIIVAKDHVEIKPNGEVVALKEGRPRITGTTVKYFDISPAYIVSGDVDMKTGNIVFSGDVIVYGNVSDGMIIESLGNVYVAGHVHRATITATGSIVVKGNIVGSNLYSGYFGVVFNRLYNSSKKLTELLHSLLEASKLLIGIVESKGKTVTPGQIMITLIENKFRDIMPTVREMLASIHNIQAINAKEMVELRVKLELLQSPFKVLELPSFQYLYALKKHVQETFEGIARMQESVVHIDINQCHLSNLKSNGSIIIRKEGVLQSNLFSKDNIVFLDRDSVCRGGELEAGGSIAASTVGAETGGSETRLKAGKRITLRKMYSGRVCIGRYCSEIVQPLENAVIYAGSRGITIEADDAVYRTG